ERETVHRFKRWYLMSTLILSLTVPLITIELEQPQRIAPVSDIMELLTPEVPLVIEQANVNTMSQPATSPGFNWVIVMLVGYGIVTFVLLVRIIKNLLSILFDVRSKSVVNYQEARLVLHNKHVIPYSFLNYIFISRQDSTHQQIILHELTHIRQRHTLDILLAEFIHCLMWFNPAIVFYKKAIRLNHEFIADEAVLKNYPIVDYQNLLFQKTQLSSQQPLTSNLNYSGTKKRFIMMNTSKNKLRSTAKIIASLAIITFTVTIFPKRTYSQPSVQQGVVIVADTLTIHSDSVEFDIMIESLKQERFKKNGERYVYYDFTTLSKEKKQRMITLYEQFSEDQKLVNNRKLHAIFLYPPNPPKKQSPTSEQMKAWADPGVYGIWLDGKRIQNEQLAAYKASDIAFSSSSRLLKNAAHYGQYKFHLNLMTHTYFDKTYLKRSSR
ncbi:MAG TPA: M56 family metallopeptidase, partial [Cyclobacteriaceae bacterium]|nr:M56 family metallopeptidase [Cyclobacteriaceae bacterium]